MLLKNKFGRKPLVLHYPGMLAGGVYCTWDLLSKICWNIKIGENDPDLTIITWNSKQEQGFLEKCLGKRGIKYVVGYQAVWNHFKRIFTTLEMLRNITTKYVLGLDNYDVLLFGSPVEVLERFKRMGCKMLVNSEVNFFPDGGWSSRWKEHEYEKAKTEFKYLNAGVWMGEVDFCINFLEKCATRRMEIDNRMSSGYVIKDCDQTIWHRTWYECFRENSDFALDYHGDIFMDLSGKEESLLVPKIY